MRRILPLAVAATLVASACTGVRVPRASVSSPSPPPIWVYLEGAPIPVDDGTTFGDLVAERGLHATDGRLLAVDGSVLVRHEDRGRIVVNGRREARDAPLSPGDRVKVLNGRDTTEATISRVRDLGRRVGDPERTLDVYPSQQVTTLGKRSGIVESRTIRSLGSGRAPRAVALTFDDGPWPGATKQVLRVLRRFHVHATFFMVGRQAARYPGLVRRVAAAGNEIGNHTFDHPETLAGLSIEQQAAELRRTSAALAAERVHTTLFRPPGGWYDAGLVQQAREQHMRLVTWSVDPRDWRSSVSSQEVAREVLQNVEPGSIVLLHDGGGDAGHTIRALPEIIRGIRKRGLGFVTIPARPA
jgi:peptidoglycan/xylan/chitin deacetylase (PgdA/CDA1 family)/sulfur carrier protein ThiS